jgi:AsmA protein
MRPGLTADLRATRIDLDALQAAAGEPAQGQPARAAIPLPHLTGARDKSGGLFSDRPIPWGVLQLADADLTLSVGTLRAGGTDTKAIKAHLVLLDGKLRLDPFSADLPAGPMQAKLEADAGAKPAPVSLVLHAPGLPLRALLAALGQPAIANGNLEIYADLHGAGETPHTIAASLDGFLGAAMANGTADNRKLGTTLGAVLPSLSALNLAGRGATTDVRCLAAHFDFQHGAGTLRGLALSSSLLTMTGGGSVDLGSGMVDLQVRPLARIGGTNLIVPVHVTGPISAPAAKFGATGNARDNTGTKAGHAPRLGLPGDIVDADDLVGGDVCPRSLALARGNPPPVEVAQAPKPKPPNAAAILRQLFR